MRVHGNTIIPASIFNRFSILCAILRQLHLVLQISLFTSELNTVEPDVFLVDQLSACIPLLRLLYRDVPVLFYGHFPDKLLAYRHGFLKRLYRLPFDWWESWSTSCSSTIVVNSNFTKSVFAQAFPTLGLRSPEVVYPCVNVEQKDRRASSDGHAAEPGPLWKGKKIILSINRFERKKEIGLAVKAFAALDPQARAKARLVIAGGYDTRVHENVTYHRELCSLAESLDLEHATATNLVSALSVPDDIKVLFLLSVTTAVKNTLLDDASLLIYTPKFEHFGIVPLEAMLSKVPVLAAETGGPKETVLEGRTGWLRNFDEPGQWTEVVHQVLSGLNQNQLEAMGLAGRQRVMDNFSQDSMALRIDEVISKLRVADGPNVMKQVLVAVTSTGVVFVAVMFMIGKSLLKK